MVVCVAVVLFAAAGEGAGGRYCVTEAVKSPEARRARGDRQTEDGERGRERQFLV